MQSISQLNSTNLNIIKPGLNESEPSPMDSILIKKYSPVLKPILKAEMYPDRFSHITLTRLEYPETADNLSDSNASDDTNAASASFVNNNCMNKGKATRKPKPRNKLRYMTQPITLIEIKESEEQELNNENVNAMSQPPQPAFGVNTTTATNTSTRSVN